MKKFLIPIVGVVAVYFLFFTKKARTKRRLKRYSRTKISLYRQGESFARANPRERQRGVQIMQRAKMRRGNY